MVNQGLSDIIPAVFNIDFINQIAGRATTLMAAAFGNAIKNLWLEYKIYVIGFIFLFLIDKYWDKGIGSVLYNIIYFSVLGFVIFLFGWQIIFNIYFEIIILLAYIVAFESTRYILRKTGIWK